jgi:hypothetical protein
VHSFHPTRTKGDISAFQGKLKLEHLNMAGCCEVVGQLGNFAEMASLRQLHMGQICSRLEGDLCMLKKLTNLVQLDLIDCTLITGSDEIRI